MKLYKVIPENPIWLGSLKHIDAGMEHYAKSLNLPNIMRFFNFVKDEKRNGACYGVFLSHKNTLYLPAPSDIVGKRKTGGNWKLLELDEKLKIPLIKGDLGAYENASGYFISFQDFKTWMKGKINEKVDMKQINDFFKTERKTGIKVDIDRGTAEETYLYTQERIRFKEHVELLFLAKSCFRQSGFFGGERNPARIEEVKDFKEELQILTQGKVNVEKGKVYRLYLLTHTYISTLEEITLRDLCYKMCKFKVLWLFSGGSEFISGFRKPAIKMLKPGSVFLLESIQDCTNFGKFIQIFDEPSGVENFLASGWNTGILVDKEGEK